MEPDKLKEKLHVDKEKLKQQFDVSHFGLNSVLRGAQLTFVGAHRALQNPGIFTSDHYKQAAAAVVAGLAIRLIVSIPVTWDNQIVEGLNFLEEYVLQVPFFLMTLMRYKHKHENPENLRDMYYPNLKGYKVKDGSTHTTSTAEALSMFFMRFARKAGISLAIFALSYVPYVGRFVLPAASFYTFNKAVGMGPAAIIFGTGIFLPRRYLVIFLQSYFSSRTLMRELLEPYFSRVHFTKDQKRKWFHDREGLLFGFALGFYTLIRIPLVGVLVYGIAEASAAYLVTKVNRPSPAVQRVCWLCSQSADLDE
ncbi:transmembrane protein UsgS [Verticillium alfalfae VaMs.102]|uniref:Transmembrane protein UsgS n=1 Tax=Verticillium alfalfae (strain VaMs.102 / ATCC MYA-4576 / FGSC 10136) TaxID=526221 RepID=C9SRC5_VERA1|nr:transmembrane protein UsgS [Verticillium alfalfae VaMs.102]EEY21340.1 transmembrane protein UsgS [Verticillium alfalfae VaMs.102]